MIWFLILFLGIFFAFALFGGWTAGATNPRLAHKRVRKHVRPYLDQYDAALTAAADITDTPADEYNPYDSDDSWERLRTFVESGTPRSTPLPLQDYETLTVLPLGSVVSLRGTHSAWRYWMIVSRAAPVEHLGTIIGYFDYAAVTCPKGIGEKELTYFNREDVQDVLFLGYRSEKEQEYEAGYDSLVLSLSYPRLTRGDGTD